MNKIEIIQDFKDFLENERSYSEYTVKSYLKDISDFNNYFQRMSSNYLEISNNVPRYYLSYLNQKYKEKSVIETFSLRSFIVFIQSYQEITIFRNSFYENTANYQNDYMKMNRNYLQWLMFDTVIVKKILQFRDVIWDGIRVSDCAD